MSPEGKAEPVGIPGGARLSCGCYAMCGCTCEPNRSFVRRHSILTDADVAWARNSLAERQEARRQAREAT